MTEVLMSPTNPDGWKLEDLLAKLREEISVKTEKIRNDDKPVAQLVTQNNVMILQYLIAAENLQRASYAALAEFKKDEGPTGTPRIGVGSPGYSE